MAETTVEFLEEWQLGALLLLASVLVGRSVGSVLSVHYGPLVGVTALVAGALVTFAVLSYLLYGR